MRMRRLFTILASIVVTVSLWAQSPEKMSYQAVIRNSGDSLVRNTQIGMQISILQGAVNGTAVYVETQSPTSNANGLVSVEIGTGITSDDFASIDWANGPYFIKTEIDPTGGSNYTIIGTSQLLSVPYALHAKTADVLTGGITETDPAYTASQAAKITSTDITNLGNLSGVNTGDQDLSGLATKTEVTAGLATKVDKEAGKGLSTNDYTSAEKTKLAAISGTNTGDQDLSALATKTALADSTAKVRSEIPQKGTQPGEMLYWNGSAWVTVASATSNGQILYFINNKPQWAPMLGENDVLSATGRIWMDRNLGASQVATSSTDEAAYGDLYQWGRAADGHESRTSSTSTTLATSDTPGHGDFITSNSTPYDWRSPQNFDLWQGVSGTNNPCPSGYRIPTEAEWVAEAATWSSPDAAGAFASPLKLPMAGCRPSSSASLSNVGSQGSYWSSTVNGSYARYLYFYSLSHSMIIGGGANGM